MSRYHLELTTNERLLLIFALGCCPQHAVISDNTEPPAVPIELATRLVALTVVASVPESPAQLCGEWWVSEPSTACILVRGHAGKEHRSRSGKTWITEPIVNTTAPAPVQPVSAAPDSDVCELGPITPISVSRKDTGDRERVIVTWRENGDLKRASCWVSNKALWPSLNVKQPTTLLVKENKGYLNIVGVKA